ncbi:uncharacterized methyltransferase-like C25B8.10 [Nematostella vectensis]|uniref:uncharacterized methyltransferase-like C25B8.10 n=1 Tax=Nematostella vectensis TaxID=45351 RepID=UPI0020774C95|nr:uncharacterized methyltransferase-like C25B8.10 [Nematostella vectensis]
MAAASQEFQVQSKWDVNLYEKGRPRYTRESVEYLLKQLGVFDRDHAKPMTILELGAGTGLFTRGILKTLDDHYITNTRVIASDPLESMCDLFKQLLPEVKMLHCVAEKIDLADESVDVVISAQAFHYFANNQALAEIHRVLVPRGRFGVIWNSRDFSVPWVCEIQAVIDPYFKSANTPNNLDNKWKRLLESSSLFGTLHGSDDHLHNSQEGTEDDIVCAIMCMSAISQCSERERKNIEARIRRILNDNPELKGLTHYKLPYITPLYWCEKQ